MIKFFAIAAFFVLSILFFTRTTDKKAVILTDKAPKPIGAYSQAIKSGNTLYVSGQIGLKLDDTMDSTSIETECRQTLENISMILKAAEMDLSQVVRATIYTTSLKDFAKINTVYQSYFSKDPPARETVEVKALPKGAHVEISVIASEN